MPGIKVPTTIFKGVFPEQFFCVSCKLLLKDPVQSACGHRFCKSCADEIIGQDVRPQCPECGEEFEEEEGAQYFPDRFVKRELGNLAVICAFSEHGCNWEGKFREYEEHVNSCEYATLSCEYCNESVHRDQIESHQQSCPYMPMQCPLAAIGCRSMDLNKDELQQHMKEAHSEHLGKLVDQVMSIEEKLKLRDSKTRGVSHELGNGYDLVEADGVASSAQCDHGVGQSLNYNSVRNIVHVGSMGSEASGFDLDMSRFEPVITEGMKSLQEEVRKSLMTELRGKDQELDQIKTAITKLEKTIRAKNAETEDRDFRLSLIENSNHDGSMIWKIPQFNQRKADAQNGKYTSIFSLPFYSGRYGYKMCLRLYIMGDGIGKGTHLSLFFVMMRGEFDNVLQWPFTHKVTFKLINQAGGRDIVDTFQPDPMSSSFRKPKSDMNVASGSPRFVSHTELERGGFIVDDTIFIKCTVATSTIHHP